MDSVQYNQDIVMLHNMFREVWEQHVMWTRSFIISTAAQLGDLKDVTNRLLQNPTDMANLFRQFYSEKEAQQFEDLFKEHLLIAAQLVNAARTGDEETADKTREDWYENADNIAAFLASINPYWDKSIWQRMLFQHLEMTEDEAVERLNGRYAEDISLFDEIESQALLMADYMSEGITRQYLL